MMEYIDICGNDSIAMARDKEGRLYLRKENKWNCFDFNTVYAGYLSACFFTATAYNGQSFYAAGLDKQGDPHLFSSLSGSVWNEHNLSAVTPYGMKMKAKGRIVSILPV